MVKKITRLTEAKDKVRIKDLLKRTGKHNLTDSEYQARENMRSPEGSRARTTQEYINKLEGKFKDRIGKPELVKNDGGMTTTTALTYALLAEGAAKALEVKDVGDGSDTLPKEEQVKKDKVNMEALKERAKERAKKRKNNVLTSK